MTDQLPDASDLVGATSLTLNLRNPEYPAIAFESPPRRFRSDADWDSDAEGLLLGDYELLGEVGRGGMAAVYKARHRTLNRIVALKVTDAGHLSSPEAAQRFRDETEAVARLDHPNIVPIYESGEAFGRQFYAMAFVEGKNLAHEVAASPLQPRRAAALMQPVAAAVAYAHSRGVVHRDLKPENILLDADGRPRITDFGIAKCSDADSRLTQAGVVIGTPSYMSPEQAQGHSDRVGPAADVYALGATLYCLLTGRPPFQAATALDTLKHVVGRDPVPPRRLNPAVDRDLETICLKCLEKSPERRYASATALAEDLQRFLARRSILARPASPAGKAARWCWRNPIIAGSLTGVVAVFLTAFALVSWSYWREAEQRAAADEARDDAQRHERAERWERYVANMTAASGAFQSQNVSVARRAVEAAPPAHRNWEWHHFRHQLDQSRQVLASSAHGVAAVRFAGNKRLVTADDSLHVWDVPTGKLMRTVDDLQPGRPWILHPAGRWMAYTNRENSMILWDLDADRRHAVLPSGGLTFSNCEFAADGLTLTACTHDARAVVWDTATGERIRSWAFPGGGEGTLGCEIRRGRVLVQRYKDGTVHLWDLRTGHKQGVLGAPGPHAVGAEFDPRWGRAVTSEGYPSNLMRMWDAGTGKQLAVLSGHTNIAHYARFSPDGKLLASCSYDQTVRLWDGATGAPVATLRGHSGRVLKLAFSPDSRRLVSASQDHTLRLWDATNGELIGVLRGHTGEVLCVDYSPDGTTIASCSLDGTTRIWDAGLAERNGVLRGHSTFVYGVAFHPDGERLASAGWDGTVRLWDATSGRTTAVLRYPTKKIVSSVAFAPSGECLATVGRDNAVRLWDAGTGEPLHHWTMPSDSWRDGRLAFSPRGDLLAAGSTDGSVYLFDVRGRTTRAVLRGHGAHVYDVAFSPDGRWLASAAADERGRSIRIWDVAKQELSEVLGGHTDEAIALAFSPDGRLLASGSNTGEVRLWDTATWREVGVMKHGTAVYGIAFTPDGTRLVTGCADNSIRFWDVSTRQEVAELRGHGSYVKALAFSPDGTRLASASGDFTVRVWDTLSARERGQKRAGGR